MIQPIHFSCSIVTSCLILLAVIGAETFRAKVTLDETDQQNRTIQQVTLRILAETFGYAMVFENFNQDSKGRFVASKNFTVPSDQSPFKAPKQGGFTVEFECRGDPDQKFRPKVYTTIDIRSFKGDKPIFGEIYVQDCANETTVPF